MRRLFPLLLAVLGALVLGSGVAHAIGENTIASSNPAAGEVVTVAPTQLQLRFTLPVGGAEAVAQMGLSLACESKLTNLGPPQLSADGLTVSAALTQTLANGTCVVAWSLPDGSTGSFSFTSNSQATTTVASSIPGGTTVTIPGQPSPSTTAPRLGGPIGLMRWIVFFAVSALFGGLMFIKLLWPEGVEYGITEKYFRQVSVVAIISLIFLIMLMTARETGSGFASALSPTSWGPLFETNEGRAVFVRLLMVCGLAWFAWITERIFEPANIVPTTILLALTMLSYGFDRASGRAVVLGIVMAVIHMTLIAIWVGSIALIWRVVLHGPGADDLVHALQGWAKIATPLTIGIVSTGLFQVWRVDGISIINSGHGRVVLFKTIIVIAMLFVSSAVRRFIVQGMQRAKSLNERVVYRLKKPVGIEMALSISVLALSSWMMSMRPPYVLARSNNAQLEYAIVQDLSGKDNFRVRLSITPGDVGANRILIELFGPTRIQNFTVSLTPSEPSASGYIINVPITRPGAALVNDDAGISLKAAGTWTAVIKGVTTIGDLEPLSTTFVIADGTTVITLPKQGLKRTTTTIPASSTTVVTSTTTSSTIAPIPVAPATTLLPG